MKSEDFMSHKHVARPLGAMGGRVPASCPSGFQGRYTVKSGDTMFFIAQRYGVSLNSLIAANPHISDPNLIFPGDVLCVPGPPSSGRVPASCPPGFQGRYTVQPGDSMFTIAQRFGVSLNSLIAANPHITNPAEIFPGDVLCVPGGGRVPASCPPGFQGRYTVQPGDTMFTIAQKYGVSLDALIAANPQITNPAVIFPGDVLCVPEKKPSEGRVPKSCPAGFKGRYTVQPGDTMFSIARKYAVSLDALIAANPHITNPNVIFPGDVLCVPEKLVLPCCSVMRPKIHPVPGSDPGGVVLAQFLSTNQESISILAVGLPDPGELDHYDGYQGVIQVPEQAEITFPLIRVHEKPFYPPPAVYPVEQMGHSGYPEQPDHPGQPGYPEQSGYPGYPEKPDHPVKPPRPPHPTYPSLWAGTKKISTILTVDTKILVRAHKAGGGGMGTTVLYTDLRCCSSGNNAGCRD